VLLACPVADSEFTVEVAAGQELSVRRPVHVHDFGRLEPVQACVPSLGVL